MMSNERSEFLKELEATKEDYVRRKVLLGIYEGWQLDTVEQWLAQQHARREALDAKYKRVCLAATGFISALGVIATVYVASIPK